MSEQIVCARCGSVGEQAAAVLWTSSVERGVVRWYCPQCSREHLRSIEGKLDEQYW